MIALSSSMAVVIDDSKLLTTINSVDCPGEQRTSVEGLFYWL